MGRKTFATALGGAALLCASLISSATPQAQQPAPVSAKTEEQPCPRFSLPRVSAINRPVPRQGDLAPVDWLDEKPRWVACEIPAAPSGIRGVVRLALTFGEDGEVISVKARGKPHPQELYDLVSKAAQEWKIQPPRMKGVPVRTMISYDVTFR